MFPVEEAIKARRSIRKYSPRKVSTKLIREILEAARWAPSAHNAQPWRFIVLTDRVLKQNLADAMANAWTADMIKDGISANVSETNAKSSVERFTQAPVLIVACVTMQDMVRYAEESRQNCEHDLAVQSLGAAIENLLLAAHSRGLGACWFCAPIFCKDAARKILRVPEDVEPQALITLGYPMKKPCVPFRKPIESTSYLNGWGKNL